MGQDIIPHEDDRADRPCVCIYIYMYASQIETGLSKSCATYARVFAGSACVLVSVRVVRGTVTMRCEGVLLCLRLCKSVWGTVTTRFRVCRCGGDRRSV